MGKKFFTYDGQTTENTLGNKNNTKAPTFWSTAVAYVQGPFGVSAGYYSSQSSNKNKLNVWSLSADYSLAPGITPYAEFTQFVAKANKTQYPNVTKNKGNVFLVGTALSF
jgi:predicted porin